MLLTGKRVIVSGGATGIGRAAVEECLEQGASVAFGDINEVEGRSLEDSLTSRGKSVFFIPTDVSREESATLFVESAAKLLGGVDCLLTAAGIAKNALVDINDYPNESWIDHLEINLTGTYYVAKKTVDFMKEQQKGTIVLIASGAGVSGPSSIIAYGATKGGVNGLGMTMEAQLQTHGIRVNVLCPGNIETPLKLGIIDQQEEKIGIEAHKEEQIKGLGDPAGVASVISFLLSDSAEYVTGAIFTK